MHRTAAEQYVVVVLDDSGSMTERMRNNRSIRKMEAAKQALLKVMDQLPATAQVGIVLLNGKGEHGPWLVPLGPVDMGRAREAISDVRADGGTPLGEYIKIGTDALLQARAKAHYGDFRLLIVTDGEATDPERMHQFLPDILSRGITVDVIGVDMPGDHSLATQVHSYRRADDPASLVRAVEAVFAETSTDIVANDEADFSLVQAIPDEAAATVLAALAEAGNQPITGQHPPQGIVLPKNVPTAAPVGTVPSPQTGPPESAFSWLRLLVFVAVVLALRVWLRTSKNRYRS